MLGKNRDPDAPHELERVTVSQKGPLHPEQGVRSPDGAVDISARQQDAELVAPESRNEVTGFELVPETRTDLAEQRIPQTMAKGIVELLEMVEIEKQERDAWSAGDGCLESLLQLQPIRQIGQAIVERLVLQRTLRLTLLAPELGLLERILDCGPKPRHAALQHVIHRSQAHRRDGAVLADGARDNDDREVQTSLLHQFERP